MLIIAWYWMCGISKGTWLCHTVLATWDSYALYGVQCRSLCFSAYPSSLPSWCTNATMDRHWPTWPTPFNRSPGFPVDYAFGHRQPRHDFYTTVHCRWPSVSGRYGMNMEHFASWSDVIKFPANLQDQTKISFILGVVPIVSKLFISVSKVSKVLSILKIFSF